MKVDFLSYLEERYVADGYTDMDGFDDWVNDLPIENLIEYCNVYCRMILEQQEKQAKTLALVN